MERKLFFVFSCRRRRRRFIVVQHHKQTDTQRCLWISSKHPECIIGLYLIIIIGYIYISFNCCIIYDRLGCILSFTYCWRIVYAICYVTIFFFCIMSSVAKTKSFCSKEWLRVFFSVQQHGVRLSVYILLFGRKQNNQKNKYRLHDIWYVIYTAIYPRIFLGIFIYLISSNRNLNIKNETSSIRMVWGDHSAYLEFLSSRTCCRVRYETMSNLIFVGHNTSLQIIWPKVQAAI